MQRFSSVVTFGDSLSDTGNLANLVGGLPFPYHRNRISDGPVAIDYLAQYLGANAEPSLHLLNRQEGLNFAVAGGNIVGNDPEDLSNQVDAYLVRADNQADSEALYWILMGGNDLRDIRSIQSSATANARVQQAVAELRTQLDRLSAAGATKFFISNLPDIGQIPETLARESSAPGVSARTRSYIMNFNQQLSTMLDNFKRQTQVAVVEFDLFALFDTILGSPTSFGFLQSQVGCFDPDDFSFHPDCLFGTRFDRFVFFDNIHPASETHSLIANRMITLLEEADFSDIEEIKPLAMAGVLAILLGESD